MISSLRPIAAPLAHSRVRAGLVAVAFGILLVGGAGFVQADALHKAAHDTRHAFGLPCH